MVHQDIHPTECTTHPIAKDLCSSQQEDIKAAPSSVGWRADLGGVQSMGVPQSGWFIREDPNLKWMIHDDLQGGAVPPPQLSVGL